METEGQQLVSSLERQYNPPTSTSKTQFKIWRKNWHGVGVKRGYVSVNQVPCFIQDFTACLSKVPSSTHRQLDHICKSETAAGQTLLKTGLDPVAVKKAGKANVTGMCMMSVKLCTCTHRCGLTFQRFCFVFFFSFSFFCGWNMMENYHTLGERQLQQLVIAAEDKGAATEITAVYHTVQHFQSHRSADCGSKLAPAFFFSKKIKIKIWSYKGSLLQN